MFAFQSQYAILLETIEFDGKKYPNSEWKIGSELRPLSLNKANMMVQSKYFPHFLHTNHTVQFRIYTNAMSFLF